MALTSSLASWVPAFSGYHSDLVSEKICKRVISGKVYCWNCFPPKPNREFGFSLISVSESRCSTFRSCRKIKHSMPKNRTRSLAIIDAESGSKEILERQKGLFAILSCLAKVDWTKFRSYDNQEEKLFIALLQQRKLAEEWRQSRDYYLILTAQVNRARFALIRREEELSTTHLVLRYRERELQKLVNEIHCKENQLKQSELELKCKCTVVNEAGQILNRHQSEIRNLGMHVAAKGKELLASESKRREEYEQLQEMEGKLQKRWAAWHLMQFEMRNVIHEFFTYEDAEYDLAKTEARLSELKQRLMVSQISAEKLRGNLRARGDKIKKQRQMIQKQISAVKAYQTKLTDAQLDLEEERRKLAIAEGENKKLQRELCSQKQAANELNEMLERCRDSLKQKNQEYESIKAELEKTSSTLDVTRISLQAKEAELLSARMEIIRLNSEIASMNARLEDKAHDLDYALAYTDGLHQEIAQLRCLMRSQEEELVRTKTLMEENERKMGQMQVQLVDSKAKLSQATSAMADITELTENLVDSDKAAKMGMEGETLLVTANYKLYSLEKALLKKELELQNAKEKFIEKFQQQENELDSLKGFLKQKETEILRTKKTLAMKEEELQNMKDKWEGREEVIRKMQSHIVREAEGISILHANALARIGDKGIDELAFENIELEAAKLNAEAGEYALKYLGKLSSELVNIPSHLYSESLENPSLQCQKATDAYPQDVDMQFNHQTYRDFKKTEKAIMHLSKFTEQLLATATAEA